MNFFNAVFSNLIRGVSLVTFFSLSHSFAEESFRMRDHEKLIELIESNDEKRFEQFHAIKTKLKEDFYSEDGAHQIKVRTYLAYLIALLGDLETAQLCVQPLAESGFAPAQLLLAGCLEHLGFPEEAVNWYSTAAVNQDESALNTLEEHSEALSADSPISIYATYTMANLLFNKKKTKESKDLLVKLSGIEQTVYSPAYLHGLIFERDGNYPKALEAYKAGKEKDSLCSSQYIAILQNPTQFIGCITCNFLDEAALTLGFKKLIAQCKRPEQTKLKKRFLKIAETNPRIAYLYGQHLLKMVPKASTVKKKKKKKKQSTPPKDHEITAIIKYLQFAEQNGYPQAAKDLERFRESLEQLIGKTMTQFLFPNPSPPLEEVEVKGREEMHKGKERRRKNGRKALSPKKTEPKKTWKEHFQDAIVFEHLKNFEAAREAYEKTDETNDPEVLFHKGSFYYNECKRTKNPDDLAVSIRVLKKASLKNHQAATFTLGDIFYETKQPEEAIEYWQKAHENGIPAASYKLGAYYLNDVGDEVKAKPYLECAQKQRYALAYYDYGLHHRKRENLKEACLLFYRGARLKHPPCLQELQTLSEEGNQPATLYLGICYFDREDFAATTATWDKVTTLEDPELDTLFYLHRGLLALKQSCDAQATEWLKKAQQNPVAPSNGLVPLYVEVYGILGNQFQNDKDLNKTHECWENALKIDPNNGELLKLLGEHEIANEKLDQGVARLSRAIELGETEIDRMLKDLYQNHRHPGIACILGTLYLKLGTQGITQRFKDAEQYLMIAYQQGDDTVKNNARFNLISLNFQVLNAEKLLHYAKESKALKDFEFVKLLKPSQESKKEKKKHSKKERQSEALGEEILKKLGISVIANGTQKEYSSSN